MKTKPLFPNPSVHACCTSLGVLIGIWLGLVGGDRVEGDAVRAEGEVLEFDVDLPWTLVFLAIDRAGE